jgi:hypothetical protein
MLGREIDDTKELWYEKRVISQDRLNEWEVFHWLVEKVLKASYTRCALIEEHVETKEKWQLDEEWQTRSEWVDLTLLIELHEHGVLFLLVAIGFLLELGDLRLECLDLLLGLELLGKDWPERESQESRQYNDSQSKVMTRQECIDREEYIGEWFYDNEVKHNNFLAPFRRYWIKSSG